MWGVRVGGVSQYREVLRIYVTKLKRTCRDQHCCSSGCLQDVRYRSLGDQGMRTQMLSDQAVRPLLSLKPHYRLLSVKIATLLELNGFWITALHHCSWYLEWVLLQYIKWTVIAEPTSVAFESRGSPDYFWSTVQGFTSRHQFLQLCVCLCSPICYVRQVRPICHLGIAHLWPSLCFQCSELSGDKSVQKMAT